MGFADVFGDNGQTERIPGVHDHVVDRGYVEVIGCSLLGESMSGVSVSLEPAPLVAILPPMLGDSNDCHVRSDAKAMAPIPPIRPVCRSNRQHRPTLMERSTATFMLRRALYQDLLRSEVWRRGQLLNCSTAHYDIQLSAYPYGFRTWGTAWNTGSALEVCWTGNCINGRWDLIGWVQCNDSKRRVRIYRPAIWGCGARYSHGQSVYLNYTVNCS